jgi:hypothetical protein
MRHDDQVRQELDAQYQAITRHIQAVDTDLGRALDAEERLVLQERRADLTAERNRIAAEQARIETAAVQSAAGGTGKRSIVDDNDLWRTIGEMRGDMKALERRIEEICRQQEREVVSGLPTSVLYMILVIGVMLIVLMGFISLRIGLVGWISFWPIWLLSG